MSSCTYFRVALLTYIALWGDSMLYWKLWFTYVFSGFKLGGHGHLVVALADDLPTEKQQLSMACQRKVSLGTK